MEYHEMSILDMSKLDGVKDLKSTVKVKFVKALQAESRGNHQEAEKFLAEALEAEAK